MLKQFLAGCFSLLATAATAQTLFTYGTDSVSVPVFLQAYHKNNTGTPAAQSLRTYLDLYIASRLKITEARARRYDTLPQITSDLASLRTQIMPAYLNDPESIRKLAEEAFRRSQKEIRVSHIFIPVTEGDTVAASKKAAEAYAKLKAQADFSGVAKAYSADPSVAQNGGDIGFITVFSLPYQLEHIVYASRPGDITVPYRSSAGYHIFKNISERKALGSIKVAQILLAFPPDSDAATRLRTGRLADSLHSRVLLGDDFGKLAQQFSNDALSAGAGGQLPEFGAGQYDASFEQEVFALKDGAVSRPFVTAYGYHIVKRLGSIPVPETADDKTWEQLQDKIMQNDRFQSITEGRIKKLLAEKYRPAAFSQSELQQYTDSLLDGTKLQTKIAMQPATFLFAMGDQRITASDWITYAQSNRLHEDGSGLKTHVVLWDEFVNQTANRYYQDHLEEYNPAFKQQVEEFRDGNLFFEIMQQEVWNRSQSDSAALEAFYAANKPKYRWKNSADAVVFYASDQATANSFRQQLVKSPGNWKRLVQEHNEKLAADSNRFEVGQLPTPGKKPFRAGMITIPVVNKSDNTVSFAYILKVYPKPAQRSFAEAKGLVVSDYQAALEKKWIADLKGKYPVWVNEKELARLIKNEELKIKN